MSLTKKVLIGSIWVSLDKVLTALIIFSQTIIFARILLPEHFGIIGVFYIFSGAMESFTVTGFSKALVQREKINNDWINTAWCTNAIRGVLLFIIIYYFSFLFAGFFNIEKSVNVIRILGLSLLIQGFNNTGTVYFVRDLNFYKQFLWKIAGPITNLLLSIPLAFILKNEWAIIIGILGANIAVLIMSFLLSKHKIKITFNPLIFKKLFNYGKWILLASIISFFMKQGDKIIITKFLDTASLGIYILAWRFARIPELITDPLPIALFPAYSIIQNDKNFVKEKFIKTLQYVGLLFIPIIGIIIVYSESFILTILGEQWIRAIIPMQILTFAVGLNIVIYLSLAIFNALGKPNFNFIINLTGFITLSIVIYPLVSKFHIIGASICYLLMAIMRLVIWKIEIYKLIELKLSDLKVLLTPLIITIIYYFIFQYVNSILIITNILSLILSFIGSIFIFIILLFLCGKLINRNYYREIYSYIEMVKK